MYISPSWRERERGEERGADRQTDRQQQHNQSTTNTITNLVTFDVPHSLDTHRVHSFGLLARAMEEGERGSRLDRGRERDLLA